MTPEQWKTVSELFTAASELPPAERQAWLRAASDDEGIRAEVDAMLTAYDRDPAYLEQAPPGGALEDIGRDALAGRRMGAYRLTREVGRGGMGVVYEAVRDDEAFDRRVAVKVLPLWGAETLVERFRFERRVLAGLDHPGIARLIDAGTDDGVPYCVMEFVEGQPVDRWCDAQHLDLGARLRLFELVCDAVSYAHGHLVVHRDLKPSNILVTADGQPKLLDFGIATLLDAAEGASVGTTRTGFTSFTPEFASPEQVRGERVTVASDVYSLGVLLYLLVTGRKPYELRDLPPLEALRVVCDVEPPRPSQVATPDRRSHLAGDLDTITATALQKERGRRYASVDALAADLRAWREHRPIAAVPPSWAYLATRFVRRHRAGVAATAALALTMLAGTAATAWQARVAERERARADARFSDVRQLANAVVGPLYDTIAKVPGSTEARQVLVKEALTYLDRLSSQAGDDIELMRELADAYEKIGDVQGNIYGPNLGDATGAKASYARLLELRRAVDRARPRDRAARAGLANAEMRVADMALAESRFGDAVPGYERAVALLADHDPAASESVATTVARSHSRLGVALNWAGRRDEAITAFGRARAAIGPWAARPDAAETAKAELMNALGNQGDAYYLGERFDEALAAYRESLAMARLAAAAAGTAQARRAVHLTATRAAAALQELGRYDEAVVLSAEAIAIQRELAVADAKNVRLQFDLAASVQTHGVIEFRRARYVEASSSIRDALRLFSEGMAASPSSTDQRFNIAQTWAWLGRVESARVRHREAVAALVTATTMYAEPGVATRKPSERAEVLQWLGDAAAAWARTGGGATARAQARSAYLAARDVIASIERDGPDPSLADMRRQVDEALKALGR